jgi:hypothetical protein
MSDALNFSLEVCRQIRRDPQQEGIENPTLDQIRARLDS